MDVYIAWCCFKIFAFCMHENRSVYVHAYMLHFLCDIHVQCLCVAAHIVLYICTLICT